MNRIILSTTLAFAAATPFAALGQDSSESPNRFSFGPSFGLNFKASFNNSSPFGGVNPGPATGGANHTYNDGYVLLDISGNAGGLTTFWGFQNASQLNPAGGGTMQFHSIQSGGTTSADGVQYGGELNYQRVIGSLPALSGDWGLEGSFGFTAIDLCNNLGGTVPVITDTYALNGVPPPGAGYNGTFTGPGPLLGDAPTRTMSSAALAGYQKLSGQMFSFRFGPFADWNITSELSLSASVGLTLAPTMLDYDFAEIAAVAGGSTYAAVGHSSHSKLLYGPFAGAMLRYDFSKSWGVYVGAQFQSLTDLEQSVGSRTARFDPGITVNLSAGMTWKF